MEKDEEFGSFWRIIYDEYQTSKRLILKLSGDSALMQDNPNKALAEAIVEAHNG